MTRVALMPRSKPADSGVSSRAVGTLIDHLQEKGIEPHSLMIVKNGHVVAEGWWSPYTAERPQLLYSVTKSFTSLAVGLAIDEGVLSLDDRIVDVLPEHVPQSLPAQGGRLTVHHLLSMTAGHSSDTLADAWQREPRDLVKGFLSVPFAVNEGAQHTYDNATTFILARMVERATGQSLPEYLDNRLFKPMGIEHAEWDRVANGAAFGFHGLHLTTEALAAFGQLLLQNGRWGDTQLIPAAWVERATSSHIESKHCIAGEYGADFLSGYGYQFWVARHGYHANGAYGQHCIVIPAHELVVVVTSAQYTGQQAQDVLDAVWELLLPADDRVKHVDAPTDDDLAQRMQHLALAHVAGSAGPTHPVAALIDATVANSALPNATTITITPCEGGWTLHCEPVGDIAVGFGQWSESAPLGRTICANGAWNGDTFTADLYIISTPHHVRVSANSRTGEATAIWDTVPLTTANLELHLRHPLMTRPDVS